MDKNEATESIEEVLLPAGGAGPIALGHDGAVEDYFVRFTRDARA